MFFKGKSLRKTIEKRFIFISLFLCVVSFSFFFFLFCWTTRVTISAVAWYLTESLCFTSQLCIVLNIVGPLCSCPALEWFGLDFAVCSQAQRDLPLRRMISILLVSLAFRDYKDFFIFSSLPSRIQGLFCFFSHSSFNILLLYIPFFSFVDTFI